MFKVIVTIILLLFIMCAGVFNTDLWKKINETSWRYDDNWAGQTITFYKTDSGAKKAIWQINGSGFCAVHSTFYNISIIKDTVLFEHDQLQIALKDSIIDEDLINNIIDYSIS